MAAAIRLAGQYLLGMKTRAKKNPIQGHLVSLTDIQTKTEESEGGRRENGCENG